VTRIDQPDPEGEAVMADAVGLALMVVLERLSPPERLALVLHDTFAVPYAEIAPMLGRSVAATKQLASRARSRVRSGPTSDDSGSTELGPDDRAQRRQVVQSFLGAARSGDFAALVSLLHPDVILRADAGPAAANVLVGAQVVTARVAQYTQFAGSAREVLVNGSPGIVVAPDGRPIAVIAFHLRGGRIIEIDILADAERLRHLDLSAGLAGQQ
jgi:RNA polymerase sigma-70 factor (ECF subfamily)